MVKIKKFNLQLALSGAKVVNRDGAPVTGLSYVNGFVSATIADKGDPSGEHHFLCHLNGMYSVSGENRFDLFMA